MRFMAMALLAALLSHAPAGRAQDAAPAPPAPWEVGVDDDAKARAEGIFAQANALFLERAYAQASASYRQALDLWDHPTIGFNLAICLYDMGDALAAYEALSHALRYDRGPLEPRAYAEALRTRTLLKASLAVITIHCDEPGAQVSLDGQALFVGPGERTRTLLPGQHVVVAEKIGFITSTQQLDAPAGRETVAELALKVLTRLETSRRFPAFVPWVVTGAGAAVALSGIPLWLEAESNYTRHEDGVAAACPTGCPPSGIPGSVRAAEGEADGQRAGAIALFTVGGVALVTGVVLWILNAPETVVVPVTAPPPVTLMPTKRGAAVSLRF